MRWPASCLALYVAVAICLLVVGVSWIKDAATVTCVPCPVGFSVLSIPDGFRVCIGVEDGRPVIGPIPCHSGEHSFVQVPAGVTMALMGFYMVVMLIVAYFDSPGRL